MILSCIKKIWFYPVVVDFRKLLVGLMELIVDVYSTRSIFRERFKAWETSNLGKDNNQPQDAKRALAFNEEG